MGLNMGNRLYDLMDWPSIEGVVYSECDEPMELLGGRICKDGFLIQTFAPDAVEMNVRVDGRKKLYPMEKMDEAGFFAVLLPGRKKFSYTFVKEDIYGKKTEYKDIYSYGRQECMQALLKISQNGRSEYNINKFMTGSAQDAYKYMGSHEAVVDGISGMIFGIWAPDARRVSVIGAFNKWDGRVFQMEKDYDTGIFFLFIPDMKPKTPYCYEIKLKDGQVVKKADPYAQSASNDVIYASLAGVNPEEKNFKWTDAGWKQEDTKHKPLSICEIDILDLKDDTIEDRIEALGFNCVEIMNVCAVRNGSSAETINFYAVNCEVGGLRLKAFIDKMHKKNISVIIDWNGAFMSQGEYSLVYFDGTHLYDTGKVNLDNHPELNVASFDYSKPQVRSFLMSNIRYWIEEYHVDGLKFSETASMLYLDYDRRDGEWTPNKFGGKENLEAVQFFKDLNTAVFGRNPNTLMIAEESTSWPMVTKPASDGGLGFNFKWNMGWMNDMLKYMALDPIDRAFHHDMLTFSFFYAFSENFILPISHDEVVHGKASLVNKMYGGDIDNKFKQCKLFMAYMMAHPGKKLLFMGADFAQFREWDYENGLEWFMVDEYENHRNYLNYSKNLNHFYLGHPQFWERDFSWEGFSWISNDDFKQSIIIFRRFDKNGGEVIVVCNFVPVERKSYCFGVPYWGSYTEVFNSSSVDGSPCTNGTVKAVDVKMHGFDQSVCIDIPAFSCMYFTVKKEERPVPEKKAENKKKTKTKTAAKKTAVKKAAKAKTTKKSTAKKAE